MYFLGSRHNDLPWNIRKFLKNQLRDFRFDDLRETHPWSRSAWSHTDLRRLKEGMVAAQVRKSFVSYSINYPIVYNLSAHKRHRKVKRSWDKFELSTTFHRFLVRPRNLEETWNPLCFFRFFFLTRSLFLFGTESSVQYLAERRDLFPKVRSLELKEHTKVYEMPARSEVSAWSSASLITGLSFVRDFHPSLSVTQLKQWCLRIHRTVKSREQNKPREDEKEKEGYEEINEPLPVKSSVLYVFLTKNKRNRDGRKWRRKRRKKKSQHSRVCWVARRRHRNFNPLTKESVRARFPDCLSFDFSPRSFPLSCSVLSSWLIVKITLFSFNSHFVSLLIFFFLWIHSTVAHKVGHAFWIFPEVKE